MPCGIASRERAQRVQSSVQMRRTVRPMATARPQLELSLWQCAAKLSRWGVISRVSGCVRFATDTQSSSENLKHLLHATDTGRERQCGACGLLARLEFLSRVSRAQNYSQPHAHSRAYETKDLAGCRARWRPLRRCRGVWQRSSGLRCEHKRVRTLAFDSARTASTKG